MTGDPTTVATAAKLAGRAAMQQAAQNSCEETRDICIKAAMQFHTGIGTGCAIVGCHAAYFVCKWLQK